MSVNNIYYFFLTHCDAKSHVIARCSSSLAIRKVDKSILSNERYEVDTRNFAKIT